MKESKVAPFSILLGGAVAFGIIIYGQTSLIASPGYTWLFQPFLWIFIPIAFIAILAAVLLIVLITTKNAIMETSTSVGIPTGIYACIAYIYQNEISVKSVLLSLLIGAIVYGFFTYVIAAIAGSVKYRNDY
jgi:hypothetical protein